MNVFDLRWRDFDFDERRRDELLRVWKEEKGLIYIGYIRFIFAVQMVKQSNCF